MFWVHMSKEIKEVVTKYFKTWLDPSNHHGYSSKDNYTFSGNEVNTSNNKYNNNYSSNNLKNSNNSYINQNDAQGNDSNNKNNKYISL